MCIYIYICVFMYVYIYIYVYDYICVCVYPCVCVHISTIPSGTWSTKFRHNKPAVPSGASPWSMARWNAAEGMCLLGTKKRPKTAVKPCRNAMAGNSRHFFWRKKKGHPMAPMQNDRNWWGKQFFGGDLHFRCLANLNPELNGFTNLYPPNSRVAWRQALPRRKACSAPSSTCGPISPAA